MTKKKILVFTGAGVSAESGIKTFRDSKDGLWYNYDISEVASITGWNKDKAKVLDFYNKRRQEMASVEPNKAHQIIADLEKHFDVTVVTQNVDNLHERAGSTDVVHLHGELNKVRSTFNDELVMEWTGDLNLGDKCKEGSQLRPHIVWFGEMLDTGNLHYSKVKATEADVCIVVGTSMQVSPANTIPFLTGQTSLIYYVDPGEIDFHINDIRKAFFYHISENASTGMQKVYDDLMNIFINKK
jgi:NAD-dependent deacetylase